VKLAALLVLAACDKTPPEFSGIGAYTFGKTTLGDVKYGMCQPTTVQGGTRSVTWCFQLPPYKIANRAADIDLYFDSNEPSAKLIEIQIQIRGCVEKDLEEWMIQSFGPPFETRANRGYWKNSYLWAAALMPSEPARCRVHLLPLTETAEIERRHAM
jgi:hypothetical protein